MDEITLITTAAVAGSQIIGSKLVEKSLEHVWDTFMDRLRGKAQNNAEASNALAKADDPAAVYKAVQETNAASDPEIVQLAEQVQQALPPQQVAITQMQIAKVIQNNYSSTVNNTFNL